MGCGTTEGEEENMNSTPEAENKNIYRIKPELTTSEANFNLCTVYTQKQLV
jgi:hypothetical protein